MERSLLTSDGEAAPGGHFSQGVVVEEAGERLQDVAKTWVSLTDPTHRQPLGAIRKRFLGEAPPAHTLLMVSSLACRDLLVEVEAIVPLR